MRSLPRLPSSSRLVGHQHAFDGCCTSADDSSRYTDPLVPSTTCREEPVERLDIVDRLWCCRCIAPAVFECYDGQRPRRQRQHVLDVLVGIQYCGWGQRPSWSYMETIQLVSTVRSCFLTLSVAYPIY